MPGRCTPPRIGLLLACLTLWACSPGGPAHTPDSLRELIASGKAPEASIHLKQQVADDAGNGELRQLLGEALLGAGQAAGAEIELQRALDLGRPPAEIAPHLARAWIAQGKHGALTQWAVGELPWATAADEAEFRTLVASAHRQLGQMTLAEQAVAQALAKAPGYVPAKLLQASLEQARGNVAGAQSAVEDILRQDADNLQARILLGQIRFAEGDTPAAIAAFERALRSRSDSVSAHAALVAAHLSGNDVDAARKSWQAMHEALPNNPRTRLLEAKLALRTGNVARAKEISTELLRNGPDNIELLVLAGSAEQQAGSPARAQSLLERAVQLAPRSAVPRLLLAQAQLSSGQYDDVKATLQPVLSSASVSPLALMLAAQARLLGGEAEEADRLFALAAKAAPEAREVRAALLARIDPTDSNIEELMRSVTRTGDLNAGLSLVSANLAKGDTRQARRALDTLSARHPELAVLDELRGQILLQERRPADARVQLEAALKKEPDRYPAVAGLAALDLAQGQRKAALERFEALRQRVPGHLQATMALAALQPVGAAGAEAAERLLSEAITAHPDIPAPRLALVELRLRTGRTAPAVAAAREAVTALPNDAAVLETLGRALVANDETLQAIRTYDQLAVMRPADARPGLRVAEIHLKRQDFTAARGALTRALRADPASVDARRLAAALEVRDGKVAEAMVHARAVQTQHPDDAAGFAMAAELHVVAGDLRAAEATYRTALAKANAQLAARQLHALLLKQGQGQAAATLAAQWLKAHPRDVAFRHHLGEQAMGRQAWADAEAQYRQVVALRATDAQAWNNIASMMTQQGKPGAVAIAERALQLSPDNPAILDTLAQALASERQLPRALEVQRRAVELAPQVATLRMSLARLLVRNGQRDLAASELRKVIDSAEASASSRQQAQTLLATLS